MKKLKALLLSTAIVIISGCSLLGKADPQEVIKEMVTNMQGLTALTFGVDSTVKYNDPGIKSTVDAQIKIAGQSEMQAQALPNATLDIDLTVDSKDGEEAVNGKTKFLVTMKDGDLYFKLESLTVPAEMQEQIGSFVDLYKGNWYKFPSELMPEELKNKTETTISEADKAKKEQIEKLIRETQLFDVLESATEGDDYVYKVAINQANLKTLASEIAKIEGQPMTEDDLKMLDEFFAVYNVELTLYINTGSRYLDKVVINASLKEEGATADMSATITLSNHNQAQEITAPAGAQDFNPMSLMGLGMMMEGSQGESLNTESGSEAIDYSELEGMNLDDLENMDSAELDAMMQDLETTPVIEEDSAVVTE